MNIAPAWIKAPEFGRFYNPVESPTSEVFIIAPAPRESARARYSLSGDPGVVETKELQPRCQVCGYWESPS